VTAVTFRCALLGVADWVGEPGPRRGRRLDRGPGRSAGRQASFGRPAALAADLARPSGDAMPAANPRTNIGIKPVRLLRIVSPAPAETDAVGAAGDGAHPAARKLLMAAVQHAPGRCTWGQLATLAGLKPSGGHFNAERKSLRESGCIAEENELVTVAPRRG
jgi:hypothetical protein